MTALFKRCGGRQFFDFNHVVKELKEFILKTWRQNMKHTFYHSGNTPGFPYENSNNSWYKKEKLDNFIKKIPGKDDDLVIEDNTIYEIDRECMEKLKRSKRRKK